MKKTMRIFLAGAMMLTAFTACGNGEAKKPDTAKPTVSDAVAPAAGQSETESANTGTESRQEEGDWTFDQTKVPPLTKQQKYIRDNRDAEKAGFMLTGSKHSDTPNVFVGIDLPESADLHFSMDGDALGGAVWETGDGSIDGLKCDSEGIQFRVIGDEGFPYGGHITLAFRTPVYEGTQDALISIDGKEVLYQDGGYVVTDGGNGRYVLQYVFHVYDYDLYGKYYLESFFMQYLDTVEGANDVIARYRDTLTIGYIPNADAVPVGEDGTEIDLSQYRDFRDVEMEELNRYGLYLDDASYLDNQTGIRIPGEEARAGFAGNVEINDFADSREEYTEIQFVGNTWLAERMDGYVNVWTPITGTNFLELTVLASSLNGKDVEDMSDREIEEMLVTAFSTDFSHE